MIARRSFAALAPTLLAPALLALALLATSLLALSLPLASASAAAAEVEPFTPAAFDAAKAAGRPILVDVTAPSSLSE